MPSDRVALSESTYWCTVELLRSEILEAIVIFHISQEINWLVLRDPEIRRAVNEEPLFWQTYRSTCQTALFIALARIFDPDPDSHSIHKVVSATMANTDFFSRTALKARKAKEINSEEWLDSFVTRAWEPEGAASLRFLKLDLRPHSKLFESVYRPIRDAIYGHRLKTNDEAAIDLFPQTNREAVRGMLDFLHDLIDAIIYLYTNGTEPVLGRRSYAEHNQRICNEARNVLRKLATAG